MDNNIKKGINLGVSLLSTTVGIIGIITSKIGGLEDRVTIIKLGLCIGLIVIVVLIHNVLSNEKFILDVLGYIVLVSIIAFFGLYLSGFIKSGNDNWNNKIRWLESNSNKKIGNAPFNPNYKNDSLLFGRYYTHEQAKKACSELNKDGKKYRLPTREEFNRLIYNKYGSESEAFNKLSDGNGDLHFPLAGHYQDPNKKLFNNEKSIGYYWTRDKSDQTKGEVFVFVLRSDKKRARIEDYKPETHIFSCRCVEVTE